MREDGQEIGEQQKVLLLLTGTHVFARLFMVVEL